MYTTHPMVDPPDDPPTCEECGEELVVFDDNPPRLVCPSDDCDG